MARTDTLTNYLTDVASAIKTKKGDSTPILASDFDTEIANLPSGGSSHDWSAIGYSGEPDIIKDGYDYAVEVKNNWENISDLKNRFYHDEKMIFMPLVNTSNATTMNTMFRYSPIMYVPLLNTSNVTNMGSMFRDSHIIAIPQFDTSNVTDMSYMFCTCYSFQSIPILNTSKVLTMKGMFMTSVELNNTSLDNILQMCININPNYNRDKTLKEIGIDSSYVATIQTLPHYQDFINAGWTTGYN